MDLPQPIVWTVAATTAVAALTDLRSRTIPNWLVAAGILLGFALNIFLGGWQGALDALLGFALAIGIYLPLYLLRAMGGGDLKLMAAVGALVGPSDWFSIFVFASLLGAVIALGLMFLRGSAQRTFDNIRFIVANLLHFRAPYAANPDLDIASPKALTMPHGVAIAAGTFFFLFAR